MPATRLLGHAAWGPSPLHDGQTSESPGHEAAGMQERPPESAEGGEWGLAYPHLTALALVAGHGDR